MTMNGHKVYTVVWFDDDNGRNEEIYTDESAAVWFNLVCRVCGYESWIEED